MALPFLNSSRALSYLAERGEDALYAASSALGGIGSAQYLDTGEDKLALVRAQLESSADNERLAGLKRVIALISKGRDASPYLASVLKLTSTNALEIRKLVYIVVLRYAPMQPDLALLSINSFQRDLSDPNPLIRGMALRTLSGMRVRAVSTVLLMAVGKAARDSHPYVRRIAAYALPKCYELDRSQHDALLDLLATSLGDRSPSVLGPAVSAFVALAPDNWTLLHRHFCKLCQALGDMDAWSQPTCLTALVRYARQNLPQPAAGTQMDRDLKLLVDTAKALYANTNAAVAMAAVRAVLVLDPSGAASTVPVLVRQMRKPHEIAYVAATHAAAFAEQHAALLAPRISAFFVRAYDPEYLALAKLRVLLRIAHGAAAPDLTDELFAYTQSASLPVALESTFALAQVADMQPSAAPHCLELLVAVSQNTSLPPPVVAHAVRALTTLLGGAAAAPPDATTARIVASFATRLYDDIARAAQADAPPASVLTEPTSRASVLWLLGEYSPVSLGAGAGATIAELVAPDVLRCVVAHWSMEEPAVQCQALTLSAKLFVTLPDTDASPAVAAAVHVLHYEMLARALRSSSSDVRDRAHFYAGLTRRLADSDAEFQHADDRSDMHAFLRSHRDMDCLRLPGAPRSLSSDTRTRTGTENGSATGSHPQSPKSTVLIPTKPHPPVHSHARYADLNTFLDGSSDDDESVDLGARAAEDSQFESSDSDTQR
ncbi:AP-3 complex subunit beta [Malassezia sp. CBS 17886]|nr:AP-3 complex subunit beta [Malassezia sp. CBS 17886]